MRAFVVSAGDGQADLALAVARRLEAMGFEATVVMGPEPDEVSRGVLSERQRHASPRWVGPEGRTVTAEQVARVLGHEAAWQCVVDDGEVSLVVDARAALADELPDAVAQATAGFDDWAVLHLCDETARGAAYILTAAGAAALLAALPAAVVPLEVALTEAALDGFEIIPSPVGVAGRPARERVLVDHLVVVTVPADEVGARAEALAVELEPGCVVLVLPAERSRLVGSPEEVLAEVARLGAPSLQLPGPAVLTVAGEGAEPGLGADTGCLHAHLEPGEGALLAVGGRALDVVHEREVLLVTADDAGTLAVFAAELDDPGSRDLARLLRYDGARDPALDDGYVLAGRDIVQVPFWTPAFCATVVRAAEAVGAFVPDDDDPVPGHEISLAAISPRLFAHLEDDIAVRLLPLLHRLWPYVDYHGLRDAFVIKYAPGHQEELRIHHDVAQVSASIKLNDGYEGAVLEFPQQAWHNAAVPVGHLVAWPSLVTHPHRTSPLVRGVKYGLTIWFELPGS